MKKIYTILLINAALISAAFMIAPGAEEASHPDISGMVSEYTGAESCVVCHGSGTNIDVQAHARNITQTTHFAFKSDIGTDRIYEYDGDDNLANDVARTGAYGKVNRYCGLPGAIVDNNWLGLWQSPAPPFNNDNPAYPTGLPGGCSRCHISNGTLTPKLLAEDDAWKTVDCLLCHAETYQVNGSPLANYGKRKAVPDTTSATGFHLPYLSGDDLAVTSASITAKPPTNNCQNCHVMAGGGYTNKRGHDYDGGHGNGLTDVHSSNLACTDCHITKDHKIGAGRPKPACWPNDLLGDPDNAKIDCGFCHSTEGQAFFTDLTIPIPDHNMWTGDTKTSHMENIACQTCHIKNNLGLDMKWFDQLVQERDDNGGLKRWKPKGHKLTGQATLSYLWFNGTVYDNVQPRGEKGDGKISPFRVMQSWVPVDDATGIMVPIKLGLIFNADSAITNLVDGFGIPVGDTNALIEKAIRIGAKTAAAAKPEVYGSLVDGEGNYTGTYTYQWDIMKFSVDHGTNPASEALACNACHAASGGILDWQALGYAGDPALGTFVDDRTSAVSFGIKSIYPNPVSYTTNIDYQITERGNVNLSIYNAAGQLIENIISFTQAPGAYTLTLDASNYASGVYTCRVTTQNAASAVMFQVVR